MIPTRRIAAVMIPFAVAAMALSAPAAPSPAPPAPQTLQKAVQTAIATELDNLEKNGDFDAAATHLDALLDAVAAQGTDRTLDSFRDAAFARRMVHQLHDVPRDKRIETLQYLRSHDALARTLAFLIDADAPKAQAAPYAVLDQLREKFPDKVEPYANLTAAICVVHDRKLQKHINENNTTAPSPEDIFDYYTSNEKNMLFGIKNVPPELLIYVVDTTSPIDQMKWALQKYNHDQSVGRHFFDVPYDYDNLRTGKAKKVSDDYTLPNILKFGGVCADQAFFAMSVGKAIGVPTAYATASSGTAGHAWVGFLQAAGNKGVWNFDVGRYPEYRGIRGDVLDPQARKNIPDSYVSVLAELIGKSPVERQSAVALADAAQRLGGLDAAPFAPANLGKITDAKSPPRAAEPAASLELLETALNQNPGYPRPWFEVQRFAQSGKLSLASKIKWSNAVLRLCGAKYPDFAAAILDPMIATVEDVEKQNQLWETAFTQFQTRQDLGADIRMRQAKLWEQQNQTAKAGKCYEEVIERYANAGPFVIGALTGAEKLLEGKNDKILKLYEQTWAKIQKPEDMAAPYMRQSNWYRVGTLYADKLKQAGQTAKADAVTAQLGTKMDANP